MWIFPLLLSFKARADAAAAPAPLDVDLWENGLPNSNGMESQGYDDAKKNFKPSIRVYLPPKAEKPAKAVVICPGGGYSNLATEHEGYGWATFFNEQGIAAIVLKYRLPNGHHEVPASDAMEAIRLAKKHAAEWNIDPAGIGIMGFSAGGHLASTVATHAPDELRPTFQILFYPVILMDANVTHSGSRSKLLGDNPSVEMENLYSNDRQVTDATPPAFIALSGDDRAVKPINSIKYYMALLEHGASAAMFIYPTGGHGWGNRTNFRYNQEVLTELRGWLKKAFE
jgi:acetyl esterase/lipase